MIIMSLREGLRWLDSSVCCATPELVIQLNLALTSLPCVIFPTFSNFSYDYPYFYKWKHVRYTRRPYLDPRELCEQRIVVFCIRIIARAIFC